jgi:hypothetical protein
MKSYLRRCKEAIIGAHVEDTCAITHHEAVQQVSNSSWYVDDNLNEIVAHTSTEVRGEDGERVMESRDVTIEVSDLFLSFGFTTKGRKLVGSKHKRPNFLKGITSIRPKLKRPKTHKVDK